MATRTVGCGDSAKLANGEVISVRPTGRASAQDSAEIEATSSRCKKEDKDRGEGTLSGKEIGAS